MGKGSKKGARLGGKFTTSHTTVVPAAALVADIAHRCEAVTKISLGFIKSGLPSAKGRRSVKMRRDGPSLLLGIRDNISHQELRVYATDLKKAEEHIAAGAMKAGLVVISAETPQ